MKKSLVAGLCVLVGAVPGSLHAQFEGVVKYDISAEGRTMGLNYLVKGKKVRNEVEIGTQGQMVMITDVTAGVSLMMMPAQKVYMKVDLKQLTEQAMAMLPDSLKNVKEAPIVTKTGKVDTIAGIKCDHYSVKVKSDKDTEIDLCGAKGMGFLELGTASMGGKSRFGLEHLSGDKMGGLSKDFADGFFVLKVQVSNKGAVKATITATKVEKKKLTDDLFAPPADFTEIDMGSMGGGGGR